MCVINPIATDSWEFYVTHLLGRCISSHHLLIRFSHLECSQINAPPHHRHQTHLSKRRVLVQTGVTIPLRQRAAPQYCDVQGEEKESQEQQQLRCQPHHPLDAAALGRLRCGGSAEVRSAASRCRDSNLRIRRGRGAATPLGSHFGDQKCNSEGKMMGVESKQMVCFPVQQVSRGATGLF